MLSLVLVFVCCTVHFSLLIVSNVPYPRNESNAGIETRVSGLAAPLVGDGTVPLMTMKPSPLMATTSKFRPSMLFDDWNGTI